MQPLSWKQAIVEACRHERWHHASVIAAGAGLDKDGWKRVAEYIEGEKAKALAALTAAWRARR